MTPGGGINHFDIQLHLLKQLLGGHYGSPITTQGPPQSVLHLGNGRGSWGFDMARIFPRTQITSYDLVAFKPEDVLATSALPPNHRILLGNPFAPLPFPEASFDFIRLHRHQMMTLLPAERWPTLLRELVRVTRPGGWIEVIEGEPPHAGGPALQRLSGWVSEACIRAEVDPLYSRQLGQSMQEAGLGNIKKGVVALPIGQWNGWIGRLTAIHCLTLFDGLASFVTAQEVVAAEAYQLACADAGKEVAETQWRGEFPLTYAYGQRMQ